jgi:hypothetical protein
LTDLPQDALRFREAMSRLAATSMS